MLSGRTAYECPDNNIKYIEVQKSAIDFDKYLTEYLKIKMAPITEKIKLNKRPTIKIECTSYI